MDGELGVSRQLAVSRWLGRWMGGWCVGDVDDMWVDGWLLLKRPEKGPELSTGW